MKKFLIMMFVVLILTGCNQRESLSVFNAGEYINPALVRQFEKDNNVRVRVSTFDSNESAYTKITGSRDSFDIVIPSDYMIDRLAQEGLLAELDLSLIPNAEKVSPQYKGQYFDPENKYSVAYMTGTLGILYNKEKVQEVVDSWNILWDEKYAKEIFMLDSERDTLAVGLRALGYSINSHNPSEIDAAAQKLIEQSPLVRAWLTDEIKDLMVSGDAALSVTYSGEAFMAVHESRDRLGYAVPMEGSNRFVDAMVVLKTSNKMELACKFINYMTDPEISGRNSEYLGYTSPILGADAFMPSHIASNPILYPPIEVLERCEFFKYNPATKDYYSQAWLKVRAE